MENWQEQILEHMSLAPYIQKAMALIGIKRRVGGNQFRHAMDTMSILIDYKYLNPVVLKAAVIHDLLEDVPGTDPESIRCLEDGPRVYELVLEVTRPVSQPKTEYLEQLRLHGSYEARILKLADRISNITDLHLGIDSKRRIADYVSQTRQYVIPIAEDLAGDPLADNMGKELKDLLLLKDKLVKTYLEKVEQKEKLRCEILNEKAGSGFFLG
ncbi:MAG TPA: hypothetical protein P5531_09420 [Bacteroidales bacterium]|nr:hypothetical protein [Bacteroidales bacterium]HSA43425.1 hypothetical protein [Bacteroidales bacterium]